MGTGMKYQTIIKYQICATCKEPLHIGNAVGSREEVLVHPVDDIPFIQASSIAGVFREYCRKTYPDKEEELFGARKIEEEDTEEDSDEQGMGKQNTEEYGSKIRFEDGRFAQENGDCHLELRARVSIDPETGTCSKSTVKGTDRDSGHKFNMEYIGAGAKVEFAVYLYDEQFQTEVEEIFAAINSHEIAFGGQKSNGCGELHIDSLKKKCFRMNDKVDRDLWIREDELQDDEYEPITAKLGQISTSGNAYEVFVKGKTEGSLLVKSVAVTDYGEKAPDAMNIQNASKEYIIPGSSWKGAVRSQMAKIASYIGMEEVVENTFGKKDTENDPIHDWIGNIRFYDAVVGKRMDNDMVDLSYRIHIDKFTGGVMQTGLFSEKNVFGDVTLRILVRNMNQPEQTMAVLLMALRDLAAGLMNIGSGYSIGKGILDVDSIVIKDCRKDAEAILDMKQNSVRDEHGIINYCMESVRKKEA